MIRTPFSRDAERSARAFALRSASRLNSVSTRRVQPCLSRARTALAVAAVVYLTGQTGLNLAVRNDWLPVRDPVYAEKVAVFRTWSKETPAPPIRVLALGSSRTHLGFDAGRYAAAVGPGVEAFNFGCPAAGPMTSALYFRRVLAEGPPPDVLFVELHPGFLTPMDPPFESRWLQPYRLTPDEAALLRGFGWNVPDPPYHGWPGWVSAGHAFRFALLNRYAPVMLPTPFGMTVGANADRFGYAAGIDLLPAERPRALERSWEQYRPVFDGYRVVGPGPAAVRDVLARAAAHGVRAAILVLPESSTFRGWYGQAGNAAFARFARDLSAEFSVPTFDAREWVPDDGFADGHHLTAAGGAAFTDRLAKESAPWVRAR